MVNLSTLLNPKLRKEQDFVSNTLEKLVKLLPPNTDSLTFEKPHAEGQRDREVKQLRSDKEKLEKELVY